MSLKNGKPTPHHPFSPGTARATGSVVKSRLVDVDLETDALSVPQLRFPPLRPSTPSARPSRTRRIARTPSSPATPSSPSRSRTRPARRRAGTSISRARARWARGWARSRPVWAFFSLSLPSTDHLRKRTGAGFCWVDTMRGGSWRCAKLTDARCSCSLPVGRGVWQAGRGQGERATAVHVRQAEGQGRCHEGHEAGPDPQEGTGAQGEAVRGRKGKGEICVQRPIFGCLDGIDARGTFLLLPLLLLLLPVRLF